MYIINKLSHDFSRAIWNKLTLLNFQRAQIALALQACAILLVFEKFTRAYLFQIALEIMLLPYTKKVSNNNIYIIPL